MRRTALDALTGALVALAAEGERPPCGDGGLGYLWTSELADERAHAVHACRGCPILTVCGAAADEHDEHHGVWGGIDRTRIRTTNRRRTR